LAGIKDVAARAGVSIATASRALSGNGPVSPDARSRVERAAKELRYVRSYNAAGLASGRSRNVGVIVPAVDRWFFGKVVMGIGEELIDDGYDLALYNTQGDHDHQEAVLADYLMRQRLDAVIPVALELSVHEVTRLLSMGRPVVGVGGPLPDVPSVSVDQTAVGELATAHLIGLGHRRIAHITGGADPDRDFHLTESRRSGFHVQMERVGAPVREEWVIRSDFTLADSYHQAKRLLAGPERPTAVFAASDEMAAGTILAARDLGLRVPDALSVIGVDGHELGEPFGLTTVQQFPERQGARAAQRLLQQLDGKGHHDEPVLHELLPTELVVRSSTTAPQDR
jgi:LacI family transcriptional regulator, repressor for deo operon, udp, cdd, tsx, nupC, and nupG